MPLSSSALIRRAYGNISAERPPVEWVLQKAHDRLVPGRTGGGDGQRWTGEGGGREGRGGVQVNMREAGESRWTEARAAPHESRESFVRPAGGHGETERLTVLGRFPTF